MLKASIAVILLFLITTIDTNAQIYEVENKPEGIVFPRMDSTTMMNLSADQGQCIYNTQSYQIECFDGGQWLPARTTGIMEISDGDGDTKVVADEDDIQFLIDGEDYGRIIENDQGVKIFTLNNASDQSGNIVFGMDTGLDIEPTNSHHNLLIGANTGQSLSDGTNNVILGSEAGKAITTEENNTIIGVGAGETSTGSENVMIGSQVGNNMSTDGGGNTLVGYYTAHKAGLTKGSVMIGNNAGENSGASPDSVENSVYIGGRSGFNAAGIENIFIGQEAGFNQKGDSNIAIGSNSGANQNGGTVTHSIFIGNNAGHSAGVGVDTVSNSILIGNAAGGESEIHSLIAIGYQAGHDNQGNDNVFLGNFAGANTKGGYSNTFIGNKSGEQNQTGQANTFVGANNGLANTSGNNNIFIGDEAGNGNMTGQGNVYIGTSAGKNNESDPMQGGNIFIGDGAGSFHTTASDSLVIDNSGTSTPLIAGNFMSDQLTINGELIVSNASGVPGAGNISAENIISNNITALTDVTANNNVHALGEINSDNNVNAMGDVNADGNVNVTNGGVFVAIGNVDLSADLAEINANGIDASINVVNGALNAKQTHISELMKLTQLSGPPAACAAPADQGTMYYGDDSASNLGLWLCTVNSSSVIGWVKID